MPKKSRQMTVEYLQELQATRQQEIDQITAMLEMMGIQSEKRRKSLPGRLKAARAVRAAANGNGHAPAPALQKQALTLAALQLLEKAGPLSLEEIITQLQSPGLTRAIQLSGASAKWVHAGWLKRRPNRTLSVTAAGRKRIKELSEQNAPPQ